MQHIYRIYAAYFSAYFAKFCIFFPAYFAPKRPAYFKDNFRYKPVSLTCGVRRAVGRVNVLFEAPQFGELELLHSELSPGGSWTPVSCVPRQRVAVIIPFRDRQLHLRTLLAILHPMLQRQMLHYTIFVVEQVRCAFSRRKGKDG